MLVSGSVYIYVMVLHLECPTDHTGESCNAGTLFSTISPIYAVVGHDEGRGCKKAKATAKPERQDIGRHIEASKWIEGRRSIQEQLAGGGGGAKLTAPFRS